VNRRRCIQLIWLVALIVALGPGPASAAGPSGVRATAVSGTFAGKVDRFGMGVVVTAEKPAAEGQARRISVYVCNGTSLSVLLTGTTTGNVADLRSADGRFGVQVVVDAQVASGKFGIAGGSGFRFSVPRAVGIAGLFDAGVAANGLVRGASPAGGSLTGRIGTAGRLTAEGQVMVTVTGGGQSVRLTARARHLRPGAYRWIVLSDRTVYGANKLGPALGGIGSFVRPTGDKHVRIAAGSAGQQGYDDKKCGQLADKYNNLTGIWSEP
jgi:hypothetical protein